MQVKIVNPPDGMDLKETVGIIGELIGKEVVVIDEEQCIFDIGGGGDYDIQMFKTLAGITVERIQEEPQLTT